MTTIDINSQTLKRINNLQTEKVRFSNVFKEQILKHASSQWETYYIDCEYEQDDYMKNMNKYFHINDTEKTIKTYQPSIIMDRIEEIENMSLQNQTIHIKKFKRPPLDKLYHIHHHQTSNMGKVLFEMINTLKTDITNIKQDYSKLGRKDFHSELSNNIKNEDYKPGDWIILAIHNDIHYYLCLSLHEENKCNRIERIRNAIKEFPQLINDYSI